MEQQGETEITLDDVTWSNLADRMWKKCYISFISEFNTGIILFSIKGNDQIAVSLYVPDTD